MKRSAFEIERDGSDVSFDCTVRRGTPQPRNVYSKGAGSIDLHISINSIFEWNLIILQSILTNTKSNVILWAEVIVWQN